MLARRLVAVLVALAVSGCGDGPEPSSPEARANPIPIPRCPTRPFDETAPLGPEFQEEIFLREESRAITQDFLNGLAIIYAHPDMADVCGLFTDRGLTSAQAADWRLRRR